MTTLPPSPAPPRLFLSSQAQQGRPLHLTDDLSDPQEVTPPLPQVLRPVTAARPTARTVHERFGTLPPGGAKTRFLQAYARQLAGAEAVRCALLERPGRLRMAALHRQLVNTYLAGTAQV